MKEKRLARGLDPQARGRPTRGIGHGRVNQGTGHGRAGIHSPKTWEPEGPRAEGRGLTTGRFTQPSAERHPEVCWYRR